MMHFMDRLDKWRILCIGQTNDKFYELVRQMTHFMYKSD